MFAICIWIDDNTLNGSVVSFNKIKLESDPTKIVNTYDVKEGHLYMDWWQHFEWFGGIIWQDEARIGSNQAS